MITWFQNLEFIEQVFAVFAIPATLVLILQTVLLLVGLGTGGAADSSLDSDTSGIGDGSDFDTGSLDAGTTFDGTGHAQGGGLHDHGFRLFTIRGFITFFTLFGWTGLVCNQSGMPRAASVLIATAAGFAGMAVTAYVLRTVLNLQSDGTMNLANSIGKTATVYIRIPARRSEKGKVNLILQEKLVEVSAVTDEETDLPAGGEVVVVGMSSNDTLLVAVKHPVKKPALK